MSVVQYVLLGFLTSLPCPTKMYSAELTVSSTSARKSPIVVRTISSGRDAANTKIRRLLTDLQLSLKPVEESNVAPYIAAIREELSEYSPVILEKALREVVVCGLLKYEQWEVDGTFGQGILLLSLESRSVRNVRRIVHHELSSALLLTFPHLFPIEKFEACNPTSFIYGGEVRFDGKVSPNLDEKLAERGFVGTYSQTSSENDFNLFAEQLFLPEARFWKCVQRYPAFKKKTELVARFYQQIDPKFTEDYFRKRDAFFNKAGE